MENSLEFEIQNFSENDFQVLNNLGKGTYGQVVMARQKTTGKTIALKFMRKKRTQLEAFLNELCISLYLSSYNGFIFTHSYFIDSADHYVLAQELAHAGSLHSMIEPGVGIPEGMVKRCALQLTRALQYMHNKRLEHRDLKPDNVIIMDKECHHIKLSDFGMTKAAGTLVPAMSPIIPYMSPKLCELRSNQALVLDPSVDIWAFGVLLYVAFTGQYPWMNSTRNDQRFQEFVYWQSFVDHVAPPRHWAKMNRKAQGLFHILLSQDPSSRNPITAVMDHLEFTWGVEDMPEEAIETAVGEDFDETTDYDHEVIVIEGEDEWIVVENYGDVECIIVRDTMDESPSGPNSTIMLFTDDNLAFGCEVEIT